MIITGNYDRKYNVLGIISYIEYIESSNTYRDNSSYTSKTKKYIEKISEQIQIYPDLVRKYNANHFFKDQALLKLVIASEDPEYACAIISNRKNYFDRHSALNDCYGNDVLFEITLNNDNINTTSPF